MGHSNGVRLYPRPAHGWRTLYASSKICVAPLQKVAVFMLEQEIDIQMLFYKLRL
jgi:hypothetical protein